MVFAKVQGNAVSQIRSRNSFLIKSVLRLTLCYNNDRHDFDSHGGTENTEKHGRPSVPSVSPWYKSPGKMNDQWRRPLLFTIDD
jgi:hypothetical protein